MSRVQSRSPSVRLASRGAPSRLLVGPRAAPQRVVACVLALLVLLVLLVGPAVRADELQDVSKLVSSGKLDDAEKRADAFLVRTPKDAQMRFLKGVILSQRGRRDEAVALFTGLTQDHPELPEPYNNLAVIHAARGEYDKARSDLESSIRVAPNYATAYENLGDVYVAMAARSYQDARRYDAGGVASLRKLTAAKALLTGTPPSAAAVGPTPVSSIAVPVSNASTAVGITRSQRNVGLPSPAGPRVTVGGFGAVAPEIVVPANAAVVPQGSNVVAVETAATSDERSPTSTLSGAATVVASDPVQPIDAVTSAVRRWATAHALGADDLHIRIDGDTAVARFRDAAQVAQIGRKSVASTRSLTLRRDGVAWNVVSEGTGR